ncbi:MAG: hypothetical protein KIT60_07080 [Burkholderiaceae bacterium]|nr:hypothetical protein [Burkholderiaceae bacterium]
MTAGSEGAGGPSLRELMAAPVELPVGTLKLPVRPMGWYQATLALEPIIPLLATLPDALGAAGESRAEQAARWMQMLASSRDEIARFAALASALPEGEIRELPPAALCELVVGLLEINADFFVRSLPLLMERAGASVGLLLGKLAAADAASQTTSSA